MKKINARRRGFTLMEVMISSVIFAVGILSSFGLLRFVIRATDFSNDLCVASALARSKIDELRETSTISDSGSTATSDGFTVAWNISGTIALRTITVNVSFKDLSGLDHSVALKSLVDTKL